MMSAEEKNKCLEKRKRKGLINRINREFEKKFFLGDIVISDQEYEMLLSDTRAILQSMVTAGRAMADSTVLAVTLVQIGIRKYDGRFWSHAEKELKIRHSQRYVQLLSHAFINTLKVHKKHITNTSETVQTILFHGFVSNYYSKGLFELLFQYFSKDLERDIYRNTPEQMQALMDTLAMKAGQDEAQSDAFTDQFMAKGSRAYKLRHHTLQAISAHPVHSRVRLRRLLRLIDRAFWKDAVPRNPTSRLTLLFKEWIADSDAYKDEFRRFQLGEIRNRGKKHFSTPYLYADIRAGRFELRLPAQIVPEACAEGLVWEIKTKARNFLLNAETYPVLTGFKTEEGRAGISHSELFDEIWCQLVSGKTVVRKFPRLPQSSVRFFDMEGDYAPRLFKIPMCAYTRRNDILLSSALLSQVPFGELKRWDFEFQKGDLVVLPDESGMIVGDQYSDGFVPRGQVPGAVYTSEFGTPLQIYASAPELLLAIPDNKINGTLVFVGAQRFRLIDCEFTKFDTKDARGLQAILIPTVQFETCRSDGEKVIVLDVPGVTYKKEFSFALIRGLEVSFDGAPYVFEERGTVVFPPHIRINGNYERLQGENGFQFPICPQEQQLRVLANGEMDLMLEIPMLSWSADGENWQVMPAGELWHTEFFRMKKLYLRSPSKKIMFFTESDAPDDEESEMRCVMADWGADGIFTADMTRFRSWLTREIIKHDVMMKLGGEVYTFASVYTRSFVVSFDVTADYEQSSLTCLCDIIGKADYYIDIIHLNTGTVIADKMEVQDGVLVLNDELQSGEYKFVLYEAEEDESGFDDLVYEEIYSAQRKLINRNDVSGQWLELSKFRSLQSETLYTPFKVKYVVTDLEKIDTRTYAGNLFANGRNSGFKVEVTFPNKNDMRMFDMTFWHEEEGINVPFLFDRKRGILVADEEPNIPARERYRRYRELDEWDYVYYGVLTEPGDRVPEPTKSEARPGGNIVWTLESR